MHRKYDHAITRAWKSVSWTNVTAHVGVGLFGVAVMACCLHGGRWTLSLSSGAADWANAIVTGIAAVLAVATTVLLWVYQQNARSRQLKLVGIRLFVDVYHRLLELSVFTDYDRWKEFYRSVNGSYPLGTPHETHVLHWDGAYRYMSALIAELPYTLDNFGVLRDNLGDFDSEKIEAVTRLFALVSGMPSQLEMMREEWVGTIITSEPAKLSEVWSRLLSHAIGACAFHLTTIDGVERSAERARCSAQLTSENSSD